MPSISREMLDAYLDDALSDPDTARLETALRQSDHLRKQLRNVIQERDRGEHSLGAIWRRQRLSCPTREQLGSFLLEVLDDAQADYVRFHLETIGCPFCVANLADLRELQQEPVTAARQRRRRFFQSSAGYLQSCGDTPS